MSTDRPLAAVLDKADPPFHAFVDGFLADALPRSTGRRIYLIVERSPGSRPHRHGNAICLPALAPRRGWRRLLNLLLVPLALRRCASSNPEARLDVLVRNDPLYLLACVFARGPAATLAFQSSFPHEHANPNAAKRLGARLLMRLARPLPDAILAVSPLGLERLSRLFPRRPALSIPVLAGSLPFRTNEARAADRPGSPVRFIYLGSHDSQRELELVLGAIVDASNTGLNAEFSFVGGTDEELAALSRVPGVPALIEKGRLHLVSRVARHIALQYLQTADVGLSVIPSTSFYREASPTKLAEYFQAGLAVIASDGIQMQRDWLTASQAGKLVAWDRDALSAAIRQLVEAPDTLELMREKARAFARAELDYHLYVGPFLQLLMEADGKRAK